MRELKFRAWSKFQKLMVPDWKILSDSRQIELMQFTGLKDKNGVEIYEWDIITGEISSERGDDIEWTKERPCKVAWDEQSAGFYPFTTNSCWRSDVMNVEVIGNIFENPELFPK